MSPALIEPVVAAIARRIGIPARGTLESSDVIMIEPAEVTRTRGFAVRLKMGWRSLEASFVPGRFARHLVRRMGQAVPESQIAFCALAAARVERSRAIVNVNGAPLDLANAESWPVEWKTFELSLRRERIVPEELSPKELKEILSSLAVPVFGMIVSLIGVGEVEGDDSTLEGSSVETISRRYERKPINREICLALKGRRCWCCRMEFGEKYGPETEGMIEVHHRIPVAGMGPRYRVHPVRDLFPVCGNCHSVIHLNHLPQDPDALRKQLDRAAARR